MKQNFSTKGLLATVLLLCSATTWAYDFYVDDIYYNILDSDNLTCEVTGHFIYSNPYPNSESYKGKIIIPATVGYDGKTYMVVAIGDEAFSDCAELTQVTIGKGVTTIGDKVFWECTGLTKFEVDAGNNYYCAKNGVLYTKDMTTLVRFPPASSLLPSYDIPNSVTTIGDDAFASCRGLTDVFIPNSVTTIGRYAFWECLELTGTLTIPENVTTIGNYAFWYCCGLTGDLIIPNSVTTIGAFAFQSCYGLTGELTIGNGVTSIGRQAFYCCSGLTGELIIPNSVTSIGELAFIGCSGLTQITIGDGVGAIGSNTFYNCTGLTEVTIGNSVTTIGDDAFRNCSALKSFTSLNPDPPTCSSSSFGVFYNVDTSTCLLYVPEGAIEDYANADVWEEFLYKVEIGTTTPVQTYEATNITEHSVTLNGLILSVDEEIVEQGFEYWTEEGEIQAITSTGNLMSATLTGLPPNTTYTYRAYITTVSGTTYGREVTFTTLGLAPPTVQTYDATDISDHSATLNGLVTPGDEEILERGFEYRLATGTDADALTINSSEDVMSVTITGLEKVTTYIFYAYVKTARGSYYGEEKSFTTTDIVEPTVYTYTASDITSTTAELHGYVKMGSEDIEERGFEYWATDQEVQVVPVTTTGDEIECAINSLIPSTKYSFRTYAKTASGTTYGGRVTFTTLYDMDSIYAELEKAIGEMYDDFKAAWTTITTEYPDAEDDCMDYYEAIYDKIKELTDMLDTNYCEGNFNDDVLDEIRSGIVEGENMIEEMLAAAKRVYETGIEDILANSGGDVLVYNLMGSRVFKLQKGNVYIFYHDNGTARKVIIK